MLSDKCLLDPKERTDEVVRRAYCGRTFTEETTRFLAIFIQSLRLLRFGDEINEVLWKPIEEKRGCHRWQQRPERLNKICY
jgi:hypothetical protein